MGRIGWEAPLVDLEFAHLHLGVDFTADVGTVRTEGAVVPTVEAALRFGPIELRGRGSSRLRVRAHDSFIQGSVFAGRQFASAHRTVREDILEVALRTGPVVIRYHVTAKEREYTTQVLPHTYSGFSIGYGITAESWLPSYFRTWKP